MSGNGIGDAFVGQSLGVRMVLLKHNRIRNLVKLQSEEAIFILFPPGEQPAKQ
jgi:hypothetical protein